ncbi:hypothetical protein ANO11243_081360 [Dothideomycetidae sp. 11243]|nr:hypothetical protein ANO11243_081360 [fungal sp. No.11243]
MRPLAFVPIIFSLLALILTFLLLFAGSKTSVLADFPIVTLNTTNLFDASLNTTIVMAMPNTVALINSLPIPDIAGGSDTVARKLGIHDFYTINMLTFCEGYRISNTTDTRKPPMKTATTNCSTTKAFYAFDLAQILQDEITTAGHADVNITKLGFPNAVTTGLRAFHSAREGVFILYCLSIGFTTLTLLFSLAAVVTTEHSGLSLVTALSGVLAFLSTAFASSIVTVLASRGSALVNRVGGGSVGLTAAPGGRFLALTWVATAALGVCFFAGVGGCVAARRAVAAKEGVDESGEGEK